MAAKGYNFFEGTQEDINRRLLRRILALEAGVADINTEIGDDDIANTIKGRIRALEDAG